MKGGYLTGVTLASLAGFFWGSMGIAAQYLMQQCAFDVMDLVSLRLAGAGVLLLAFMKLRGEEIVAPLLRDKCWVSILIYGLGMLGIQLTFFLSIAASNAATAALMVTTGSLFVTVWTAFSERRAITGREWICLALAIIGVGLIVTKGRLDVLDFSISGCLWGITSAVCGAFCTIQPRAILRRVPVGVVVGWGMTIGGFALSAICPPDVLAIDWTPVTTSLYLYIAVFGTVAAFCCYLGSLRYVPAPVTSLLAAFEPLSAVVLGVLLLGLSLNAIEVTGIGLIFVMVFLLSRRG